MNGYGIGEYESLWIVIMWGWGYCNCFWYNIGEYDVKKVILFVWVYKFEE